MKGKSIEKDDEGLLECEKCETSRQGNQSREGSMGELRNFARRMSTFTKFGGAAGDDIPNCSREVCVRARAQAGCGGG